MPKRLVICCDGTWNTPDQATEGWPCPTNVTKVALEIAPTGEDGVRQCIYYLRGVGTARGERFRGGAFGVGLSRAVKDAYRTIVENYEPGDELWFFGFSRGAFTARSTAGLVRTAGVLERRHADRLDEAYELYRCREAHPRGTEARLYRRSYSWEPEITFIGVWDTVGALGLPVRGFGWLNRRWAFHDTTLSSTVRNAFQALAVDEFRRAFRPTLWEPHWDDTHPPGQRLEQVWFAGAHSAVGGGYRDTSLSDVALLWMVERARECGLGFAPDAFLPAGKGPDDDRPHPAPDPCGELRESRTGLHRLLPRRRRPIGTTHPRTESLASTAALRYRQDWAYRPANVAAYLARGGRCAEVGVPVREQRVRRTPEDALSDRRPPAATPGG
ncbi:putative alpha/beta hydrolase family protein DUF2235 [Geodermatophilus normandii]|uniref:Putative alpha/beta hydrolase family protein DUF2235 n=1 Tax=Geodermatophilus normandii TaxID=1137989 RepID=A0A317QMN2_9ACTN|nr:DUF2235 domain-containing protein [Geodermatophilus normandii]PWW24868.1 putative alpha/beta hydrolase family protein DUF2235 [Geodermatophilus normandii]